MDMKQQVMEKLKKLTGCDYVMLMKRGNNAIYTAFYVLLQAGYTLRIPDQGGWMTYRDYPPKLGLGFEEYPTDDSKITEDSFDNDSTKAYIVNQPGGYFVPHDLKMVRDRAAFFILDASGSIGKYDVQSSRADIVLGSFSEWKPVDLGCGGFFATNSKEVWEAASPMFESFGIEMDSSTLELLKRKLDRLPDRYSLFKKHCRQIKADLQGFSILHPEANGICVVAAYANEEEKGKIIEYCDRKGYEYTRCPRYIRVNRDAISIEVKRLT